MALNQATQREAELTRRLEAMEDQWRELSGQLQSQRASWDADRQALANLQRELEALRARPSRPEPAARERELIEARNGWQEARDRAGRLERELKAARSEVAMLNRELALALMYSENDHPEPPTPPPPPTESSSPELGRIRQENERLRSILKSLGIVY